MKTIINIEGIDGSGKTSALEILRKELNKENIKFNIGRKSKPKIYQSLFHIEEQRNWQSNPLPVNIKFGVRVGRLFIAFKILLEKNENFIFFDRGLLDLITNAKMDKIPEKSIISAINEYKSLINSTIFISILLDLPVDIAYKRNLEKVKKNNKYDLNMNYLKEYRATSLQSFNQNILFGSKHIIDTSNITQSEVAQKIKNIVLN